MGEGEKEMQSVQADFFVADVEEQAATVAMDVDDVDPLEIFSERVINLDNKLADADFFNNFDDDSDFN